ncbi:hypothetical protein G9C98_006825 [Cotesia typhae]|uniref:Uncharacterized protein n=1 Tax=Cotesia typhae TaxID=2053667 RepID=A0A8J5RA83_9HYME|nr:hypothetical protein G9C98_006825 [Cotesia typhae]
MFQGTSIWVAFDFLKYSSQVCLEICNHLKIMLFRIPYSNDSDKNGTNRLQRTKSTKKHH